MATRKWCDTCRGDGGKGDELLRCAACPRRFHIECAGLREAGQAGRGWKCPFCSSGGGGSDDKAAKRRIAEVRRMHKELRSRSSAFFTREKTKLVPFVDAAKLEALCDGGDTNDVPSLTIGASPAFVRATLRDYQVAGVNWLLSRYSFGAGGILADEMGLGKTIQTLSFLAALKDSGRPGPHLVVTPLAVLQNWSNEIKRFTPGLTHVKIHGSRSERDRLLSKDDVTSGEYDIYLTTYDTLLSEEAFFTESFLFHTVVIDEGHRLKNAHSKLCKGLARLTAPFRVLLTGTPLQNNLNELWALLQFVLPRALDEPAADGSSAMSSAASAAEGSLDRSLITQARALLESCMIRRVKSDVTAELKPKIEYVLKAPLTKLQREWYRSFLEANGSNAAGLLTAAQLMSKVMQLGKVANHPKTLALTFDRERSKAAAKAKQAEGSEFVKLDHALSRPRTAEAAAKESELRGCVGEKLVASSGKLALLDRLLLAKKRGGSRALIFSQFTLTLDVLEEYLTFRFGRLGSAFLRLDGGTNRIQREMDMRAFNADGSDIFCYLISTRAGGQGINLATADTVVLYDTCWNPQVDLQAQDRAHRIGQKKQVIIYRLISESTVEERVLARARQKMVLDALVMKKRGEGDGSADSLIGDDDDDGEETLAKLSVDELWSILSQGADRIFNPTTDKASDLSASDYDMMLAAATPAKWDDDTSSANANEAIVVNEDDKPSETAGSALDGTIFDQRGKRNDDAIDLISSSSDDEATGADKKAGGLLESVDTSSSSSATSRPKRARAPPKKFSPPWSGPKTGKKKRKMMQHDANCFQCRGGGCIPQPASGSKDKGTPKAKDAKELLPCIACPRVYHLGCAGLAARPKSKSWYCPWHSCVTCERKSSDAGGTLFHCASCPLTYCFDCCPDEHTTGGQSTSVTARELTASLERRGMASLKSFMFFTCGDCRCSGQGPFSMARRFGIGSSKSPTASKKSRGPSPKCVASIGGFCSPASKPSGKSPKDSVISNLTDSDSSTPSSSSSSSVILID